MSGALQKTFAASAQQPMPKRQKRPPPLSVRVSMGEKSRLQELAGEQSLNAYIRSRIFGDKLKRAAPCKETLARILAELGRSEVAPSLRSLAAAAEVGALILDDKTREQLNAALAAVLTMRAALIQALSR